MKSKKQIITFEKHFIKYKKSVKIPLQIPKLAKNFLSLT